MSQTVFRLTIQGRVQGVYYRQSMVEQALALGVAGWVRNRADGSVEAMVAGPEAAVQSLIAWAQCGPDGAIVSNVTVVPASGAFSGFQRLPTV